MKQKNNSQLGFTLVEIAIVVVIIGLFVAGVLRAQELLNNARLNSTIREVKSYEAALVAFKDMYNQIPGDMGNAMGRIPGCNAGMNCGNGGGDGVLGVRKATYGIMILQTGISEPQIETTYFWKHLALSHLITGVEPNANPDRPEMGRTNPSAKFSGGFIVVQALHGAGQQREGINLLTTNTLSDFSAYNPDGKNPLNPLQARYIDQKMDDGLPDAGDVSSPDDGTCDRPLGNIDYERVYLTHERKTCLLLFIIG